MTNLLSIARALYDGFEWAIIFGSSAEFVGNFVQNRC